MNFIVDKQTLDDLNITGKYKPDSIFNIFNKVHTTGGEKLLENMFSNLLPGHKEINKRSNILKYFQSKALVFPFNRKQFDVMENYLAGGADNNLLIAGISNFKKKVLGFTIRSQEYEMMQTGVQTTVAILNIFYECISKLDEQEPGNPYLEQIRMVKGIFSNKRLGWLYKEKIVKRFPFFKLTKYNYLLRYALKKEVQKLTEAIYYLDVYIAVGNVAKVKNFSYANALPKQLNLVYAEGVYHPSLKNAIGNAITFHNRGNVFFLTGANMAGKSTLMKTFGIAIYLAHMGFPVAAKTMEFSIKDGIYSSINVPDNLNMGLSHFYAEVLRVKKVAEEVSAGKDIIVIFDELFKGTNVKDAYDATLAVTEAFAEYRNCFFIISTHIIEVGDTLKERCANIQFAYLPTILEGTIPRYTYQLQAGITSDRQGMVIIENEGILDILGS
jgi:DNA mismatch repair protein MutS